MCYSIRRPTITNRQVTRSPLKLTVVGGSLYRCPTYMILIQVLTKQTAPPSCGPLLLGRGPGPSRNFVNFPGIGPNLSFPDFFGLYLFLWFSSPSVWSHHWLNMFWTQGVGCFENRRYQCPYFSYKEAMERSLQSLRYHPLGVWGWKSEDHSATAHPFCYTLDKAADVHK